MSPTPGHPHIFQTTDAFTENNPVPGSPELQIHGLNKLTLLDYPDHMACTVFTGQCNLRCPFCQNASLVLFPDSQPIITHNDFFDFLQKRRGKLEGVCVTGGEPTLCAGLPDFLARIKELGFAVKLDTNGTNPDMLARILDAGLADYAAMDIKSSPDGYANACGLKSMELAPIRASVQLLMQNRIPYEFRTTVVKELHGRDTFTAIGEWLHGASAYYLQAFEDSGELVCHFSSPGTQYHSYTRNELEAFLPLLTPHIAHTDIRGLT